MGKRLTKKEGRFYGEPPLQDDQGVMLSRCRMPAETDLGPPVQPAFRARHPPWAGERLNAPDTGHPADATANSWTGGRPAPMATASWARTDARGQRGNVRSSRKPPPQRGVGLTRVAKPHDAASPRRHRPATCRDAGPMTVSPLSGCGLISVYCSGPRHSFCLLSRIMCKTIGSCHAPDAWAKENRRGLTHYRDVGQGNGPPPCRAARPASPVGAGGRPGQSNRRPSSSVARPMA